MHDQINFSESSAWNRKKDQQQDQKRGKRRKKYRKEDEFSGLGDFLLYLTLFLAPPVRRHAFVSNIKITANSAKLCGL